MQYNDNGYLVIRKNVAEQVYFEEADYYFGDEDYKQYWEEHGITEDDVSEWRELLNQFDILGREFLVNEDFYYGQTYMFVIQRKSDGAKFGIRYFYGGGKHGESMFQEEINDDYETYSFKPVEPFVIQGYRYESD